MDAEHLEDGTHRAAGDDAGAGGRRAHHDLAGAVAAGHVVVQRPALAQRHADHLALGLLGRLADRLGHLAGLALAVADATLLVADHDERREAEALAALHRLRHPVDRDEAILELRVLVAVATLPATAASGFSCHVRYPSRTSGRPRGRRPQGP
jgi:hypothetical protein